MMCLTDGRNETVDFNYDVYAGTFLYICYLLQSREKCISGWSSMCQRSIDSAATLPEYFNILKTATLFGIFFYRMMNSW